MSFKIVDFAIIHSNNDIEIEYFLNKCYILTFKSETSNSFHRLP